jgi:hypothetical protein
MPAVGGGEGGTNQMLCPTTVLAGLPDSLRDQIQAACGKPRFKNIHLFFNMCSASSGSVQSVETVGNSEGTATSANTETSSTSQTPSCRALAGSLASFDTSSIHNTEGVPLLEENEFETEGSNSVGVYFST